MVIDAPEVCDERLETNDLAEIQPDGSFKLLGRRDNVICSGGIKLRIEQIEAQLAGIGVPYQITASPDERLGETVTLLMLHQPTVPRNSKPIAVRSSMLTKCPAAICA